jgi:hypothetical protein
MEVTAEKLAQLFHETYERLAPGFSYETRKASAKPWLEVPEQNRKLMIATCAEVLHVLRPPRGAGGAAVQGEGPCPLGGEHVVSPYVRYGEPPNTCEKCGGMPGAEY